MERGATLQKTRLAKSSLQVTKESAHSTGAVAERAPRAPTAITAPLRSGIRAEGAQRMKAWNEAMRHAETPKPIRPLPNIRPSVLSERAKTRAPAAAKSRRKLSVRLGPNRSRATPTGIWPIENARK